MEVEEGELPPQPEIAVQARAARNRATMRLARFESRRKSRQPSRMPGVARKVRSARPIELAEVMVLRVAVEFCGATARVRVGDSREQVA